MSLHRERARVRVGVRSIDSRWLAEARFLKRPFPCRLTPNTAPAALESVFGVSCDLSSVDSERRLSRASSAGYP